MWCPDLVRGGAKRATLVGKAVGTGREEVLVLLDPPRHALPAEAYATAQKHAAALYGDVPRDRPFLVGLQDEPWEELERAGGPGSGDPGDSAPRPGGFGIVSALRAEAAGPSVLRLEDPVGVAEFRSLEGKAITVMGEVAPFFAELGEAMRNDGPRRCTPTAAECLERMAGYRSSPGGNVGQYLTWLRDMAARLGVSLDQERYRPLREYQRLRSLESGRDAAHTRMQAGLLTGTLRTWDTQELGEPRAAWEVYAAGLVGREGVEDELAAIDGSLATDAVPDASPEARRALSEAIRDATEPGVVRVATGRDKVAILGPQGEKLSVGLELVAILGIETGTFDRLAAEVVYAGAAQRAGAESETASLVDRSARVLEAEIAERAAESEADRLLLELIPTVCLFQFVGRFQVVHDQHVRATMLRLNVSILCERLQRIGVTPPRGWREQTAAMEDRLDVLRRFFDRTVLRGKDLAGGLVRAMRREGVERGLLCCDGFQHSHVARWLEGHEVGHVMIAPSW